MVTYFRERTGPNFFRVFYKGVTCIRFDPVETGRVFGIAKFTPWVNEMREWAKEMVGLYDKSVKEDDEVDPTTDTKMIV